MRTNKNDFPVFDNFRSVTCFGCGQVMDQISPKNSGYPNGRGEYTKFCPDCQVLTFFDVNENWDKEDE